MAIHLQIPAQGSAASGGLDAQRARIDDDGIRLLVERFYAKVLADPLLGPIFQRAIASEAWPKHLQTMFDFWSSVMLTSGRYKGNPLAVHGRVDGIAPELFETWLALFYETADELFYEPHAAEFREKAERIARSIRIGLFYRPEFDRPRAVS